MGVSLTVDRALRLRLLSQHLAGDRPTAVTDVVRRVFALQAQSTRAARLAVRPRGEGVDAATVDRACNEDRSVVRTWAMRGTLHMVAAEDVGWLVEAYRPSAGTVTARHRQLGLDADVFARALPAMRDILAERGPLTRQALVAALVDAGVAIEPKGQAPAHLVGYAARQGLVCRGPDVSDDEPTYVLLADWAGPPPTVSPDEALDRLARRFVAGYGPVGVADFAYWSGLSVGPVRRALSRVAADLEEVEVDGEPAWLWPGRLEDDPGPAGGVRLVPAFDVHLLAYRNRDVVLDPRYANRIQAGGGMLHPAVLVDGRVVGTWRQQSRGGRAVVTVEPFGRLARGVKAGLEAEAADLGRFQGVPAGLEIAPL